MISMKVERLQIRDLEKNRQQANGKDRDLRKNAPYYTLNILGFSIFEVAPGSLQQLPPVSERGRGEK